MSRRTLLTLLALWIAAVAVGMGALVRYSSEPGIVAAPLPAWPEDSTLTRPAGHTLVFVAHPRCPCTRASISELAWLMTHLRDRMHAYVLFVAPDGTEKGWEHTDLWESAAQIDGVTVVSDPGGHEATRFGAATSGQVYLYDPSGALRFEGGITPARGHQGDSVGRRRIVDIVTTGATDREHSAVYGCEVEA